MILTCSYITQTLSRWGGSVVIRVSRYICTPDVEKPDNAAWVPMASTEMSTESSTSAAVLTDSYVKPIVDSYVKPIVEVSMVSDPMKTLLICGISIILLLLFCLLVYCCCTGNEKTTKYYIKKKVNEGEANKVIKVVKMPGNGNATYKINELKNSWDKKMIHDDIINDREQNVNFKNNLCLSFDNPELIV